MRGVTFRVLGEPERDLSTVLRALGPTVAGLQWRVEPDADLAGAPPAAAKFERWSESGDWLNWRALQEAADGGVQMVGGELTGRKHGEGTAHIIVRAVRGDDWDILTDDPQLLARVKAAFPDAVPFP